MRPLPPQTRLPDLARHLRPEAIAALDPTRLPQDGDWLLAELAPGQPALSLDLISGRTALLYPGDPLLVVAATYHAPLGISGRCPPSLCEGALLDPSGIVGLPLAPHPAAPRLRLLGVAVDATGRPVNLADSAAAAHDTARPQTTVAVVSASRGARASVVAEHLLIGLGRMGLVPGIAKPIGMVQARERWRFLDAGARLALDPADTGRLDCRGETATQLLTRCDALLSRLAGAGCDAAVLRVAGGLAVPEVQRLLAEPGIGKRLDGVILAAADGLSAVEGVARIEALGGTVMAISGALLRSPLAAREAAAATSVPLIPAEALSRPQKLARLLSDAPAMARAALELEMAA